MKERIVLGCLSLLIQTTFCCAQGPSLKELELYSQMSLGALDGVLTGKMYTDVKSNSVKDVRSWKNATGMIEHQDTLVKYTTSSFDAKLTISKKLEMRGYILIESSDLMQVYATYKYEIRLDHVIENTGQDVYVISMKFKRG
ncbi:hypothetical protein COB64_03810 [Candidatus Wolfebacteria bacterium]|nr:MAG: hypothetical protein COB64_03810 [Candidatus Wolfebacteria bacterium]